MDAPVAQDMPTSYEEMRLPNQALDPNQGQAQSFNRGADVFLADEWGT